LMFPISPLTINSVYRLDRELDLVSPLVTPLTYEGLVDEVVGIVNGKIKVDAVLLGNDETGDLSQMKLPTGTVVTAGEIFV
jgi:vacuolar protein sorting-associated protein 33A